MKIKNIFFDFDGVIAESVSAKTEAFREMYLPYGEDIANKVVTHHIAHGGVSRYEKFEIYAKDFLNTIITEEEVQDLVTTFSSIVLEQVVQSELVVGVLSFLEKYCQELNFWIITGTPTTEMEIILEKRKLRKYFIDYCGSPKNKKYWTEYLIEKHKLERGETLFLGDASTDLEAAEFSKLHFALRLHKENKEQFKNYKGLIFGDFVELEKQIKHYLQ